MQSYFLRIATKEDIADILRIYAPYVQSSTASFEYAPPSEEQMMGRFELNSSNFPWIVCVNGDTIVGYAYASRLGERPGYNWAAAASVYVDGTRLHSGAGSLLYRALFRLLAAMNYRTLYGIVSCPNPESEAFHEKMGFVRQGLLENVGYKFGRPLSVAYYGKALMPVAENPPPPLPFCQLDANLAAALLHEEGQAPCPQHSWQ